MSGVDHTDGLRRPGRGVHRPSGRRRRAVISAVVVLVLFAAGGGAWWYLRGHQTPFIGASKCPAPALRVVAAPEIAPVVSTAAEGLAANGCATISVTAEEPGVTVLRNNTTMPDMWIPSASAWLQVATANGFSFTADDGALAVSPVVIAAPATVAQKLFPQGTVTWGALVDAAASHQVENIRMPDPQRNTVGLLSEEAVRAAMAKASDDPGIAELRALTLRSRLVDAAADPATLLATAAAAKDEASAVKDVGVFTATEQQLWQYGRNPRIVPLAAGYLTDYPMNADYPMAIHVGITTDPARQLLAEQFITALRAPASDDALVAAGFRLPPGQDAVITVPAGLTAKIAEATKVTEDTTKLLANASQWVRYQSVKAQLLLLIDTSGSMNAKVADKGGNQVTKAKMLQDSGRVAAKLFTDNTGLGLWIFGTPTKTSPAHTEVLPVGPMNGTIGSKTRGQLFDQAIDLYTAAPSSGTPLYRSVLDATELMRTKATPDTLTLVVVLTDGADGDSPYGMTKGSFLSELTKGNAKAQVPVYAIGFGKDADMGTLNAMAKATGGQASEATNPADLAAAMSKLFLAANKAD